MWFGDSRHAVNLPYDQPRVRPDVQALSSHLDGKAQRRQHCRVLGHIVSRASYALRVAHDVLACGPVHDPDADVSLGGRGSNSHHRHPSKLEVSTWAAAVARPPLPGPYADQGEGPVPACPYNRRLA